jgi:hypothetical protein
MEIPLRNRKGEVVATALVDADDYERVSKYKWYGHKVNNVIKYARAYITNGKQLFLQHFIFGKPGENMVIDHINGNGLDNCKSNLREVTYKQNSQNRAKKEGTICKYIGIKQESSNKFSSSCCGKYLGVFITELDAARQYDIYTYLTLGKDSKTNNLITYEEAIKFKIEDIIPIKQKKESFQNILYIT